MWDWMCWQADEGVTREWICGTGYCDNHAQEGQPDGCYDPRPCDIDPNIDSCWAINIREYGPSEQSPEQCFATTSSPNFRLQNYPNSPTSYLQGIALTTNQDNVRNYHFVQTGTDSVVVNKPKYYPISASTLAGAEKQFKFPDEKGIRHASMTYVRPWTMVDNDTKCITEVRFEVTAHYPDWKNVKNQCKDVRDHWNNFMKSTAVHEDGHIKHAQEFFEELAKELIGKTKDEANKIIEQKLLEYKEKYADPYDQQTDHGVTQGADLNDNIRCAGQQQFQTEGITGSNNQPLASGDNLEGSNEAGGSDFGDGTSQEQSREEELREEIEEDVDECDLDPDDPWCASLRVE